ncbi:transglutaminase-like cysteine peptidase [Brevundimonas sp.]|uniref:transglutaminase-like cysteine peptidase n=1 Tax=Brevundimonas sp. TaxID=1871086 RepID=UPI00391B1515
MVSRTAGPCLWDPGGTAKTSFWPSAQPCSTAGVPAEALSIAIVETRWGETHAVLLLASDRGEFVLDSLSPWVSRWDRVDYRWRERQARGGAFDWVNVAL